MLTLSDSLGAPGSLCLGREAGFLDDAENAKVVMASGDFHEAGEGVGGARQPMPKAVGREGQGK